MRVACHITKLHTIRARVSWNKSDLTNLTDISMIPIQYLFCLLTFWWTTLHFCSCRTPVYFSLVTQTSNKMLQNESHWAQRGRNEHYCMAVTAQLGCDIHWVLLRITPWQPWKLNCHQLQLWQLYQQKLTPFNVTRNRDETTFCCKRK